MDRVAVFVDAGHLFAGGSAALSGGKAQDRKQITLKIPEVVALLASKSLSLSKLPLLRIYWYDGALPQGLTTTQWLLASADNVKLRLGVVNVHGEQKGVDAKIVTDLSELARNGAICDAVLVGGDEDLRLGVELAQDRGVRVHLLTVEGSTVSRALKCEADTTSIITVAELGTFLTVAPIPATPPTVAAATSTPSLTAASVDYPKIVTEYLSAVAAPDQTSLKTAIQSGGTIPREHDGIILARARESIGRNLTSQEKKDLRHEFKKQLGV